MSRHVGIKQLNQLGRLGRIEAATELWRATMTNERLKDELPYPAHGYSNPVRGARRLRKVAESAPRIGLSPYLVVRGWSVLGMATLQLWEPTPNPLPNNASGVEFSYWHKGMNTDNATELGVAVLGLLHGKVESIPSSIRPTHEWMVTLPDDETKNRLCWESDFVAREEPQLYNLDDGVQVPRMLWIRDL